MPDLPGPRGRLMFAAWCPAEGHEVLLGERHILHLDHDGSGTTLTFRCWCDHVGTTRIERRYRRSAPQGEPEGIPA